jgi:hypothetical protein
MRRLLQLLRRRRRPPAGTARRSRATQAPARPAQSVTRSRGLTRAERPERAVWPREESRGPARAGGSASSGAARVAGPAVARAAIRTAAPPAVGAHARPRTRATARPAAAAGSVAALPWYERARVSPVAVGQRHCGHLERILHRQWAPGQMPPPEVAQAIERLAELPQLVKERLVAGLDAIYVGPGGVPDLDDMSALHGVPLPSGHATWDACAGAYGDRKVIVGSRPSPTPDVMCHEIGHALDDIDGRGGEWQSDSAEFIRLYQRCLPWMCVEFHRSGGPPARREFFADAFAAIASSQRPALVEMLNGNTRVALAVMLYFNVRYGI